MWRDPYLFQYGRGPSRQPSILNNGGFLNLVPDSLDLLDGEANVSPGVASSDRSSPLDEQDESAQLHVAHDVMGCPMVDRQIRRDMAFILRKQASIIIIAL